MMDLLYTAKEGPCMFPSPGWVSGAREAEALREPPRNFTDTFNDNIHWVQTISQEQDYANHGPQVNQATEAARDPRMMAPPQADGVH